MPEVHYRIELQDGSVREGRLDSQGKALEDNVPPGECTVFFPDIAHAALDFSGSNLV
ncbi:MAG: hypothetical protein ACJ8AT_03135 [Hyalangium sp.]|uniref:hypothetical protein n=1 Tax=Hyalangium sp. TaxID=2028555 RepID=UPI00389A0290